MPDFGGSRKRILAIDDGHARIGPAGAVEPGAHPTPSDRTQGADP